MRFLWKHGISLKAYILFQLISEWVCLFFTVIMWRSCSLAAFAIFANFKCACATQPKRPDVNRRRMYTCKLQKGERGIVNTFTFPHDEVTPECVSRTIHCIASLEITKHLAAHMLVERHWCSSWRPTFNSFSSIHLWF